MGFADDQEDEEVFLIKPENLTTVLTNFFKAFKSNPLYVVPMDEAEKLFTDEFGLNEDGEFQITENDMKRFMDNINNIQAQRILDKMEAEGLVRLAHDGTDFCYLPTGKTL